MIWQTLKHGGFEGGEKIEYFKLSRCFKLLVTHSTEITESKVCQLLYHP
jgi:hypothetical protein